MTEWLQAVGWHLSSYVCFDEWLSRGRRLRLRFTKKHWTSIIHLAILITLCHGIGLGWLSPMLPQLQSSMETPVDFVIDVHESSWLGAMLSLGALTGNFLFSYIMNRFGRKVALYGLALPNTVSLPNPLTHKNHNIVESNVNSAVYLVFVLLRGIYWNALRGQNLCRTNGRRHVLGVAHFHWRNSRQEVSELSNGQLQFEWHPISQHTWSTMLLLQPGYKFWYIAGLHYFIACALPCDSLCRSGSSP